MVQKSLTSTDGGVSEINWTQYLAYLLGQDKAEDAKKLSERAPEEFKKSRDMRLVKAQIHRFLGENAEAEKLLSALHQENSDDFDAADQLALVLVESTDEGKRARAEQISEANARRAPNLERTIATAAWVKFRTGSTDIADKALGQILRSGRFEPQTAYYMAMLYKSRGMLQQYARFMDAAVSGNGAFPQKRAAQKELAALIGNAAPSAAANGTAPANTNPAPAKSANPALPKSRRFPQRINAI